MVLKKFRSWNNLFKLCIAFGVIATSVTMYMSGGRHHHARARLQSYSWRVRVHTSSFINRISTNGNASFLKQLASPGDSHSEGGSTQACVHPELDPFAAPISTFFQKIPNLQCSPEDNWVYVRNGTFRLSGKAKKEQGNISCDYIPVVRGKDDFSVTILDPIKSLPDGSRITSDFFKVDCVSAKGNKYSSMLNGIAPNENLSAWSRKTPLSKNALGLDVLMIGFDSLSRMTWQRTLPLTRKYFLQELKGMELEGYNIVGDGTPQALLPILTGMTEEELPEARRGHTGARSVNGHPWIWKDFKKNGYITMYSEDAPGIGAFTYRMLGFNEQPTDFYLRPFYMVAEESYSVNKDYCLGSLPRHMYFLNWFRDAYLMFEKKRKFLFGFHSEITHEDNNKAQLLDDDLKNFLQFLNDNGYLDNTVLILMSDHGARFSQVRASSQGKLEERLPYFSFRFPTWFSKKYPQIIQNFEINAHRLTSPFDIHETLKNMLNFTGTWKGDVHSRGISLFNEIPAERTCAHAGIAPHWCACLDWEEVNHSDTIVQAGVRKALSAINNYTLPHRQKCANLRLSRVVQSMKFSPNPGVLKFKQSKDHDGRVPDLTDTVENVEVLYQITFVAEPGGGQFEVTLRHWSKTDDIIVDSKEISRINRYGSAPHCVQHNYPYLRPYCYCKTPPPKT